MTVSTGTGGVNGHLPTGTLQGSAPSPPSVRLERRRWRDPRLVIGAALVASSAVGVAWAVNAADERVAVWTLRADVPTGATVSVDEVVPADVQVPDAEKYWLASDPISANLVAVRDFSAGELLARSGVEGRDSEDIRIVTLPVLRNQMPADLGVGSRVDVYVVARTASGEPASAPQLVLRNAIVSAVDDDAGAFGGTSLEVGVALSLPDSQVAKVLDAQAHGALTLVDVPVATP